MYQLNKEKNKTKKEMDAMKDEANKVYENVLKNELFGPETTTTLGSPSKILQFKPKEPFKSRRLDFGIYSY